MKPSGAQLREIKILLEKKRLIPVIDRVFEFANAPQAMDYLDSGRAKGKVIVSIKQTRAGLNE
ncbi:zinc-binding dehydrogenase [Paenibacillus amylolyticus]|nr:zinc-binding dehydrogenase [Paenibacillus amylolyticus]WFR60973.1 zinc-binding dehydrogenase [Paenibacillus amylolyticus]